MNDSFDIVDLELNKNYVIEASAGTGKTYNIVQIVNKLVTEFKIDINQILIVTYTEKAANELKNRISNEISGIDLQNASIGTIHSFCTNMLKEFPISSNMPLSLDLVDERYLDRCSYYFVRNLKVFQILVERKEVNKVKEGLKSCILKYYLNSNNKEDKDIISLQAFDEEQVEKVIQKFLSDKYILDDTIKKYLDVLLNSSNSKLNELGEELIKFNYVYFNGQRYKINKSMTIEEKEAFNYFKNFKDINHNLIDYIILSNIKAFYSYYQTSKLKNKKQDFNDMIRYVRESIIKEEAFRNNIKNKYKYAIIDEFQDTNAIQYDIFKHIFLNKDHNLIVVGDPKQSIYAFQGADVFVYHKAKKDIIDNGGIFKSLTKNFRSTKEMVTSCNKLFNYFKIDCGFTESEYLDESKENANQCLYKGKPIKGIFVITNNGEGISENDYIKQAVYKIIDFCKKDNLGNTSLQIKDFKDEKYRSVKFNDIAFLVDKKAKMKIIEKELKKCGIPYNRYKDDNLFNGKECFDFIVLLEAINSIDFTGNDRFKFKRVLYTNFFGYSLQEITKDKYNKDDCNEMILIQSLKAKALERNWPILINDILLSTNLTTNLSSLKDILRLSIYKQIGNYCLDYLIKNNSLSSLINNLRNLYNEQEDDEDNGAIIEKSTDYDCIQIMTMHASKGLQFPIVIPLGGYSKGDKKDKAVVYYDENNQKKLCLDTNKNKNDVIEEKKRLFYVAYTRAKYAMLIPRILKEEKIPSTNYQFLYNSIEEFYKNDNNYYEECIYNSNILTSDYYTNLKLVVNDILQNDKKDIDKENELRKEQEIVNIKLAKSKLSKCSFKHSYSSLSHPKQDTNIIDDEIEFDKEGVLLEGLSMFDTNAVYKGESYKDIEPIESPIDFPKGALIGTVLHEIFEHVDFKNQANIDSVIDIVFNKYDLEIKDTWRNYVRLMVKNVLEAKLEVINGNMFSNSSFSLNELSNEEKLHEVEFNFNLFDERLKNYCNGFIDLLIKRNDRYIVLDWKSDKLNDDFTSYKDINILKQHVDEHYSIQRVLYCYCLINWLKQEYKDLSLDEIFDKHFGGIYYVFIRGCNISEYNGIYAQTWSSYSELKKAFDYIMDVRIRKGGNL